MTGFPGDFCWGSSTAAHQVEGGNTNNDWWQWEHTPGSTAVESSGDGIDHWNRYDSDFALLAALGQNAHRFSLEWSRIEPAEGEFSQAALDHYARVLESLARHGLTAFATIYHFTLPQWFAARGGWLAHDALDLFGRYADKVARTLGDLIPYACTINEPQIVAAQGHAAQMGWEIYPEGFGEMLRRIADTKLPIVVTENGIATVDDKQRIRFLATHLQQLKHVIDDGVDVRGYLYWSSFDNFEWAHGYAPTFGLIGIDRDDHYRRIVRPSAVAYGAVARSGSLDALTSETSHEPPDMR